MNRLKKLFSVLALIIVLQMVTDNISVLAENKNDTSQKDTFTIKMWTGFRFSDEATLDSTDYSADIRFIENPDLKKVASLFAVRIKVFPKKPDIQIISTEDIDKWDTCVNAPIVGYYYIIKGTEKDKYYLLELKEFAKKSEPLPYWTLTFTWEEIVPRGK
ncbi:MAG: hypothetical protein BWY64_00814 [bacterium ADurb.Bin363]|nr:MAG: hypothetical protein BWY64_00814 [bacterium ADurb.Bin363]